MLTAERLRELLHYDPKTGVFTWRMNRQRARAGDVAGWIDNKGYRMIETGGRAYCAHRLAWVHFYGGWPAKHIDHINGDRLDNRIANLRDVSRSCNLQNQRTPRKDNSSGYLGVSWHAPLSKWRAAIRVGKLRHLGYFDAPEEAHAAYLAAKRKLHEGCTI